MTETPEREKTSCSGIVIHGASSFIGKNLINKLIAKNIPATVIARENSRLGFQEEACPNLTVLRYRDAISELDPKQIGVSDPVYFEFAWSGVFGTERNNPSQLEVNIPLTIASVNFAHLIGARHWIGFGSQAEYGNLNKRISETEECHPTTLYGKSKLLCSRISAELCKAYGMEHSWLRLFSVFGPNDNHAWLIPYLIGEMKQNKDINTTLGEQSWDYLYIDDIIEMLLRLKEKPGVGIANLGSGRTVPVREIILELKRLLHSSSVLHFGAIPYRPDQVMYMEADITRLSSHLDWFPKISVKEGLLKMIQTIQDKE